MSSAACKDRHGITEPEVLSGVAVFVSDPATRPALAQHQRGAQAGDHVAAATTAETEVVYVSLPPGSFPDGVAATVRNERTGGIATAVMSDGGFDPIALQATAGDVLQFEIRTGGDGSNTVRFERSVPAKRRPVVVRTNPPRGKRDVPLNARIEVVFSEPIDSRTTAGSVRLVRGTTTVPARLEFTDAAGLMLALVPEQLLETSTTYAVVVSDAVRDLDGDPLERTVSVEFVTEPLPSASVRITTVTTGSEIDPDGYAIAGDFLAGEVNPRIGPNSTVTIPNVPPGQRYVRLVGVAENCTVKGLQQRPVTVAPGATTPVVFEIECVPPSAMRITATTSGVDLDPDGYTAQVQRMGFDRHVSVPVNGGATTAGLLFGEFLVTASGVSANCDVSGPNPQVVTLASGGTTEVSFSIVCAPATLIAYSGSPYGTPDTENSEIYVVKSNGTGTRRLTTHAAADVEPDWSPDGDRIAFRSDRDGNGEIYVMNADGSAQARLTTHAARDYEPAWSPDGSRIAFVSERDGNPEIYVMNADGTNPVRLTTNEGPDVSPAWSPDGSRIAFRSERLVYGAGNGEIVTVNADGSNLVRLTNDVVSDDAGPAWSPDGSKIAFARFIACEEQFGEGAGEICRYGIFVMNADGSGVARVAGVKRFFVWGYYADDEKNPAWSPDGRKIAIGATTCVSDGHCHLSSGITVVTVGAPGYVDVTAGHAFPVTPAWRR